MRNCIETWYSTTYYFPKYKESDVLTTMLFLSVRNLFARGAPLSILLLDATQIKLVCTDPVKSFSLHISIFHLRCTSVISMSVI